MDLLWPSGWSLPALALKKRQTGSNRSPDSSNGYGSVGTLSYPCTLWSSFRAFRTPSPPLPPAPAQLNVLALFLCCLLSSHINNYTGGSATLTLLLGESLSCRTPVVTYSCYLQSGFSHVYIIFYILFLLGRTSWARSIIRQESLYSAGLLIVQMNNIK